MDEEIYGVAFDFFIPPVNPFFEIGACQNRSGTQEQGMQQGKFARAEQFDKPVAAGGLALSRYTASAVLLGFIWLCIGLFRQRSAGQGARVSGNEISAVFE